jgi:hypothetical protein
MGVFSTSEGQGRRELWLRACGWSPYRPQNGPNFALFGRKGTPGDKEHAPPDHGTLLHDIGQLWPGRRDRGLNGCCAIAARVRANSLHGAWRAHATSPKVPDGRSGAPHRLHMMYESCWEGVHAGRGPRSLFCGRAVGLAGGDRRPQVDALARPTRAYNSAMLY